MSDSSLAVMEEWRTLDTGWDKGHLDYGHGVMVQNVSPKYAPIKAPLDNLATYYGHGGEAYAYQSDNGFFPKLNASISVITAQDTDFTLSNYVVTCKIVELVAAHRGVLPILRSARPPHGPRSARAADAPSRPSPPHHTPAPRKVAEGARPHHATRPGSSAHHHPTTTAAAAPPPM